MLHRGALSSLLVLMRGGSGEGVEVIDHGSGPTRTQTSGFSAISDS
ncbi:hypothetical protein STRTUCAR8_10039 [Streptomyces turgidiscabies Car8]|uniref:Uncharacterized protein n=1 Tax=Streptomyces turgidiscabies (strain Car8) TaxID=698760 RepID=L7EW89_STRT8|nr:hypothetical protein STRTUCAR8_10039 [Streptomyces turgidiscabies Car8]